MMMRLPPNWLELHREETERLAAESRELTRRLAHAEDLRQQEEQERLRRNAQQTVRRNRHPRIVEQEKEWKERARWRTMSFSRQVVELAKWAESGGGKP